MKLTNNKLRLKAHFRVELVSEDDVVLLLSEEGFYPFEGTFYKQLIPLLDGNNTFQEIASQLQEKYSPIEVARVINQLTQDNYLANDSDSLSTEQSAFWDAQNVKIISPSGANRVSIHAYGSVNTEPLLTALQALDIHTSDTQPVLKIALAEDYLNPDLREFSQEAAAPWMLVKPVGVQIWIGPVFVPEKTACWECLAHRLRLNRKADMLVKNKTGNLPSLPRVSLPATQQVAMQLAATQVTRWIVSPDEHPLLNKLITLNPVTMEVQHHTITKRPQCPVCGDNTLPEQRPIILESQPKSKRSDGGHRTLSPEEMLDRYQHHVSPITGIVDHLKALTDDGVTHVYSSGNNHPWEIHNWETLRNMMRNNAGGKGVTEAQAKASALGEALERYSSNYDKTESYLKASYARLCTFRLRNIRYQQDEKRMNAAI